MIVLDMGSANVNKNDITIIKKQIDTVNEIIGDKSDITVLKWQLFESVIDGNIPLTKESFEYAFGYAKSLGLMTTASVFDIQSLYFLLSHPIPFVKLANGLIPASQLLGAIPRGMKILYSTSNMFGLMQMPMFMTWGLDNGMCCVSNYPATIEEYEKNFSPEVLIQSVSDHTEGAKLWDKYHPMVWEKHFCLEHSDEKDCGSYALDPKELREIYNGMRAARIPENPFEKKKK